MARKSELARPYWLDEELVWGVEVVLEEPSSSGNPGEARWTEFTGKMNTCRLFGPGGALLCGWGSRSVPVEENRLIRRPSTSTERD